MVSIGLDVGTGFVKCVSDYGNVIFPSLFAYRDTGKWEESQGRIEAVGKKAREFSKYPDTVIIRPVSEGRPIDDRGFGALVTEAVSRVCRIQLQQNNLDGKHDSEIGVIVGLPYDASKDKMRLRKIIAKSIHPKNYGIVPQALGTLIDMNKKDAIIMSIGQGTTEIVAFDDRKPVFGTSVSQATDFITLGLGEFSYLQASIFANHKSEIKKNVAKLTDILSNKLIGFMSQLDKNHHDIVVSGGGIMIPGMKESLEKKIEGKIEIPKIPIMSNAIGLYKLATRR